MMGPDCVWLVAVGGDGFYSDTDTTMLIELGKIISITDLKLFMLIKRGVDLIYFPPSFASLFF